MLKKTDSRSKLIAFLAFPLCIAVSEAAFSQTARSKAEQRFSPLGWVEKAKAGNATTSLSSVRLFELPAASDDGNSSLERYTGEFPSVPIAAIMPGKAAAPILPGAGSLDFASFPPELISLFENIAASLKASDYSGINTSRASAFMPIMLEYMMRRLPQAESLQFAGVKMAADGKSASAILRLKFADTDNTVFATAEAVLEDEEWRAADVIFDGDSYEKAAKPARM